MTRSFQVVLADEVSVSFAAAMMRPMFSFDMKSGNGDGASDRRQKRVGGILIAA
jgi:hypothetical protein